jgi:hypothetical protein
MIPKPLKSTGLIFIIIIILFILTVEGKSQSGLVAFHVYLSTDSPGPLPAHHSIKFDTISLNKGDEYNVYAFDENLVVPVSTTYT